MKFKHNIIVYCSENLKIYGFVSIVIFFNANDFSSRIKKYYNTVLVNVVNNIVALHAKANKTIIVQTLCV